MTMTPSTLETVIRADHVAGPPQGRWTVADLDALPDDGMRYQILDGVLHMAPAPVPGHQRVSRWLVTHLTIPCPDDRSRRRLRLANRPRPR